GTPYPLGRTGRDHRSADRFAGVVRIRLHRIHPAPAGARAGMAVPDKWQQRSDPVTDRGQQGCGAGDRTQRSGQGRWQTANGLESLGGGAGVAAAPLRPGDDQSRRVEPWWEMQIIRFPDKDLWERFNAAALD